LVPIALIALLQARRDFSVQSPKVVNVSTVYLVQTQQDLMSRLYFRLYKVYYVPKNAHTDKIMHSVRKCLGSLLFHIDISGFTNETEMINTYVRDEDQMPYLNKVGVVFEQYNELTLKYKLRHSFSIPNDLYQSVLEMDLESIMFQMLNAYISSSFVQVQICVDEAFIKEVANSNVKMSIQKMPDPPGIKIDKTDTKL
ncbi:PREDICTED: uncharacterized protein LOC105461509, partial [Wasmannia auropunctata]|uniref:uncharacterized protein LOC105461509 n=1 Tax=Wasmannia auropunctata TaxID=64793 RepID=UPI0005EF63EA